MTVAYEIYSDRETDFDDERFQPMAKDRMVSHTRRAKFRKGKSPVSVNGIHRRRVKKFTW